MKKKPRKLRFDGMRHDIVGNIMKDDAVGGLSLRPFTMPPLLNAEIRKRKKKARKSAQASRRINRGR